MAAPNTEHSRFRRTFAPAFAEKAVREQEPLIQKHIEILIEKLKKETINKEPINILKWFEYLTFDIVGDLCFSNSFGCLESNENHIQIDTLQNAMKYFTLAVVPRVLGLEVAKKFVVPAITRNKHLKYYKSLNDWTHQRFDEGENPAKNDLMTYVYRYLQTEKKGLSLIETENAFGDFMIAGSETVATTLAAAFFHLTRHPDILQQLNQELLSAVKQESGITLSVVSELPFLNAVIMESMRLCPSLPTAMPRIVPPSGSTICGHYIPSGVSVHFYLALTTILTHPPRYM
jgi:cytochrome P450